MALITSFTRVVIWDRIQGQISISEMDTHLWISLSIRHLSPALPIALPALDGLDVIVLVLLAILHNRELRHLHGRFFAIRLIDARVETDRIRT